MSLYLESYTKDAYSREYIDLVRAYASAHNIPLPDKRIFLVDCYNPTRPEGFDYYLVENAAEPLHDIANNAAHLIDDPDVYFLVGSFLHDKHLYKNKTLTFPGDWKNCLDWYTRPVYFTSLLFDQQERTNLLTFINGQRRSVRHYFLDSVKNYMDVVFDNNTETMITNRDRTTSRETREFIEYCNKLYNAIEETEHDSYKMVDFGNFGQTRLGYVPLQEYFTSNCVVYPETTFENWEIYPTEKTFKCIKALTHWILFAGAGSYEVLRKFGFRSIVELCPDTMNDFDMEVDHFKRIDKIRACCAYIKTHPKIFQSYQAKTMLTDNYYSFHNPSKIVETSVKPFIDILLREL